ncbi:MAG: DoxX family protein [Acidobacteria bacterium]|nr:DoxX family protein [Acidobacteriota bacterium]
MPSLDRREIPLALLRILIGWHFFYEALPKLIYPGWSSAGYLQNSTGPLAPLYQAISSSPAWIQTVDLLNIFGLLLIGLALMTGLFTRYAAAAGIALLGLYYFAYPPWFAPALSGVSEGSYLIVNKNVVELAALAVVIAFPAAAFGLDGWLSRRKTAPADTAAAAETPTLDKPLPAILGPLPRRQLITSLTGVPFVGALVFAVLKKHGWKSLEEVHLDNRAKRKDTFVSSATVRSFQFTSRRDLRGSLPAGKIGNVPISRLILGGNLMGGWAHARDLIYVSKLVKAYHHRDKIFETLALAESCSVNTILTNPALCEVINDYWRNGGKIQFISDCGGKDVMEMTRKSIDRGACACYIQGGVADRLVEEGKFDLMAQTMELVRRNGLPAGIGAHSLKTVQAAVERGLIPDFWMKTLHHTDYWSAKPNEKQCDNIWCEQPVETAAFMRERKEPWIAFKVMAAGAITPKVGFRYAFENGADFVCAGMYDFQIVDDVNLALEILNKGLARNREWRA